MNSDPANSGPVSSDPGRPWSGEPASGGLAAFSLLLALVLIGLMPLLFGQLMASALAKLHLSGGSAFALILAMFAGSFVNIPVRTIVHDEAVAVDPLAIFGVSRRGERWRRIRRKTTIAVNVGGCLIPVGLAVYEALLLAEAGGLAGAGLASSISIAACYALARPIPGIGIALPAFLPGIISALAALLLANGDPAPVAFIAGVAGPLIGADLLHLKDVEDSPTGIASIGGAGTFDGIILSGIIAAYLA